MPGFTTHYILGMKAYNDMPQNNLKFIIAKYRWLYQLGLQGPDMFFYNLPVLRHRDHRNVGSYMHEHHVNDFFRCAFTRLSKIESRQQREEGLAFLCGFISHYIGDSICHLMYMAASTMTRSIQQPPVTVYMPSWKMTLMPCY